jgi:hypothetical protein
VVLASSVVVARTLPLPKAQGRVESSHRPAGGVLLGGGYRQLCLCWFPRGAVARGWGLQVRLKANSGPDAHEEPPETNMNPGFLRLAAARVIVGEGVGVPRPM